MSGTLRLSILIEAIDRASRPMAALQARLGAVAAGIVRVGAATQRLSQASGVAVLAGAFGNLAGRARDAAGAISGAAGRLALLAGGGAFAFNRVFVRGAADFERYRITLETVMGSAEAADRRLAELNAFASSTPFNVGEVVQAGVALQTLGIRGAQADRALTAVGDAAAVFGTSLPEALTAFSAALRGEMDPIERFGVQARTEGNRLVFQWEENGRRMRAAVDKNNRAAIAAVASRALEGIAGGGMQRLAGSWDGMVSNLLDAWSNFRRAVAEAGPFDWLKDQLRELLALIGRLQADGTLDRWARETGAAITRAFQAMRDFVIGTDETPGVLARLQAAMQAAWRVVGPVVERLGGLEATLFAIALVIGGPVITALASLTGAIALFGFALLFTPAGWFLGAIALIGGAAALIVKYWRPIRQFFVDLWGGVTTAFTAAWDTIRPIVDAVVDGARALASILPGRREGSTGGAPLAPDGQRRFGQRGSLEGFYGAPAMPDGAGAAVPPVRVDAGVDVHIRLPDGVAATVTPRGSGDVDVRTAISRGTLAMPVP